MLTLSVQQKHQFEKFRRAKKKVLVFLYYSNTSRLFLFFKNLLEKKIQTHTFFFFQFGKTKSTSIICIRTDQRVSVRENFLPQFYLFNKI